MSCGIADREVGNCKTKHVRDVIGMDNIHLCSTYDLRQELKKRGYFQDNYCGRINHNILMVRESFS